MPSEQVSRYFFKAGLINIVTAAVATLPVLVPQLGLPLKLEVWPGTWMFIAYFVFLITGVVGSFIWCFIYYMLPKLYGKDTVSDFLALAQLVSFEIAIYGIATFMGIEAGYYGGTLYHNGFGQVVITQIISWVVIPVGTLIVIALLSTITGIVNLITATTSGNR
ncbi:MAG: hypothetical protein OK455_06485 [Thaumarchaeota archaeon]|nr:hypothetical protein [Nitrososphaerota archaeon]